MSKKLTKAQQLALLQSLTPAQRKLVKAHFYKNAQAGMGIVDSIAGFASKAAPILGPIASVVGPMVLKEFILPFLKKKFGGSGYYNAKKGAVMKPMGNGLGLAGKGLKLAGGKKGKGYVDDFMWAINTPISKWKI